MKVEIGESLCYSYLRHVKQCWLVQSNWKLSEHWDKVVSDSNLEHDFAEIKRLFDSDGSVFKKTKSVNQLLKQGEIDILGVSQDSSIHAVDVAFHKGGLNYGGGADKRVLKKLLRTMMILKSYLSSSTKLHIYFLSPKVHKAMQVPMEAVFERLESQYPTIEWNLFINDSFTEQVVKPTLEKTDSVEDTSELFARAAKLLELSGMYRNNLPNSPSTYATPKNASTAQDKGSKRDTHRLREERIQECIKILNNRGYGQCAVSEDADFDILAHRDGSAIRVRVASRLEIKRSLREKDLHLSFPVHGRWYLILHDELVRIAGETTPWLQSDSWQVKGWYSSHHPSRATLARLNPFAL